MKKRFLSALLALCMVLTMLPLTGLTAFAADENDEEIIDVDVYKAECLAGVAKDDHSNAVEQCNRLYNYYINENIYSPTQSYLDSMHANGDLMALYTVWRAYSLELTPSAALNRIVTTEDYYESIVLAMMQKALQEQSDLKQLLNNKIMNDSKNMVSTLCEITSAADAAELANTMDLLDPDTYNSVTEAISETYAVGTASKVIGNVSLILEAAENVVDAVDRFAVYASMVELDESAKLWLEQMYNACDAQTPVELKTAISNLKNASTGFADAALVNVQETTFALVNWSVQATLDAGLGAAAAMNPVTQAVWIGLQASKTICDIFFGSDEVGEQLYVMECIYGVQELSRRVAEGCKNTFLGDRTTANAQAFNYAVDCYYESIINIDIDCMLTFLDKLYNGGLDLGSAGGILTDGNLFSWIYGTPADYQEIVDDLEGLRQTRMQNKQHMETYFRVALQVNYPATFNYYFADLNEVPVTDLYILVSYYLPPAYYDQMTDAICMVEGDYGRFYVSYDPDDATLTDYTVEVSDPEVLQVKDGIIQALKPGTTTVTVTSTQNDLVFDTREVTVLEEIEGAQGDDDLASRRFTYTVTNGEATITGLEDGYTPSVLYIPATIDGYPVTGNGSSAFRGCNSLTSVTIPDSVTSIGGWAFSSCASLESITIPNSVTNIGGSAFRSCHSLTNITVDAGNPNYSSENGVLFNKAKTELIQYPVGKKDTTYSIPDSVTSIGSGAFSECYFLTSIPIPNSVTSIGETAFAACASLTSITIPDSVTRIGPYAFLSCVSLKNVTIGSGMTEFETVGSTETFQGCFSLKSIAVSPENPTYSSENGVLFNKDKTRLLLYPSAKQDKVYIVPSSVKTIGACAFYSSRFLESVILQDGVECIEFMSFFFALSIKDITIPGSVTMIGGVEGEMLSEDAVGYTFMEAISLENITVSPENPVYSSENGVLFNKEKTRLIKYPEGKTESVYEIPDGVNTIAPLAFAYFRNGFSVDVDDEVPANVHEIIDTFLEIIYADHDTFSSVMIPRSVTSIGEDNVYGADAYVFLGHDNLTIYGYAGSFAETYAAENEIPFVALTAATDAETGVTVESTPNGTLPENAQLTVEQVAASTDSVTYDITLTQNGVTVQPTGAVTVKIPVPDTMDGNLCRVYREETDGTYTDMNAVYQNGCMVFTTDHFSIYRLTGCLHAQTETEITAAPTCTEAGEQEIICTSCGEVIATQTIPATGHSFSEWVTTTEPTCTEVGEQTRTCSTCGATETQKVPAKGHTPGEWVITKEPTRTEEGERTQSCTVCGEVLATESIPMLTGLLGDVNADGKVDAVDARWVLQAAAGMRTLENMTAADVNADGKIDAVDARWILQAAAGMRTLDA